MVKIQPFRSMPLVRFLSSGISLVLSLMRRWPSTRACLVWVVAESSWTRPPSSHRAPARRLPSMATPGARPAGRGLVLSRRSWRRCSRSSGRRAGAGAAARGASAGRGVGGWMGRGARSARYSAIVSSKFSIPAFPTVRRIVFSDGGTCLRVSASHRTPNAASVSWLARPARSPIAVNESLPAAAIAHAHIARIDA